MSNIGRPRTGLKACGYCGSTERDSNGQCHCRNVAYRVLRTAAKTTADKARRVYDSALKSNKGSVEKALASMREEFPSLAAKARKAPADKKAASTKKGSTKKTAAAKTHDPAKPEKAGDKGLTPEQAGAQDTKSEPERYVLNILDDFTDPKPYARKDAAIKNGVRSDAAWNVTYKGKVVAQSDDVL
jgi:hypothetical protein